MDITVVIRIIAGGLQFHPCLCMKRPSGHMTWKWRRINVDATWFCTDVDMTSFWHQMPTGSGGLTLHNLIRVCVLLDTKNVKRRDWLACSNAHANLRMDNTHIDRLFPYVRTPPLSISTNIPPSEYYLNLSPPPPIPSEHSFKDVHNVNIIVYW